MAREEGTGPNFQGTMVNMDQSLCLEVMEHRGQMVNKMAVINEEQVGEKGKLTEPLTFLRG